MYVELKNINKTYGSYQASRNVNFGIEKGKLIGLLGPSGSGKTTILRMIAGLETPDSGEVIIDGKVVNDVPASQRGIGFVFQNYALFRYMTVYDNVAFALRVTNVTNRSIRQRVPYVLGLVGLAAKARNYPDQLSGGEQQRVALARALVNNPPLLIADEPTGNIDPELSLEIVELLNEINKYGTTVVMVTHEHELVSRFNRRVITIDHGSVVGDGSLNDDWGDFYEG